MQGRRRFRTYLLIAGRSSTLTHSADTFATSVTPKLTGSFATSYSTKLPTTVYLLHLPYPRALLDCLQIALQICIYICHKLASKLIVYFAKSYALNSKYCTICIDQIFTMSALKICQNFFLSNLYTFGC